MRPFRALFRVVRTFCRKNGAGENTRVLIEAGIRDRAEEEFSHSDCPAFPEEHYGRLLKVVEEATRCFRQTGEFRFARGKTG